jgi:uncharacterized repeat protein (TIGR03803 family)
MHRRGQLPTSIFRTISLVAIATLVIAAAAIPALAQNSVPPTAVQAAKMPQYASRLAHPVKRVLPPETSVMQRAKVRRGPLDSSDIYDNGSINGNTDAWTINFGFIVSDSFNVTYNGTIITGMSFGAWLYSGDTLTSVEVSITSGENSGTSYFDQTVNFTQGSCTSNQYGYNVCTETGSFNGPTLNAGTYWVNLQNASVPSGDPVYWDENSGVGCQGSGCPSQASQNSVGSIPSEAFTILGNASSTTPCSIDSQQRLYELRDLGQFTGSNYPSGVAIDRKGTLYGTLSAAGNYAQGLFYELSQRTGHWFVSSLYNFLGGSNGSSPSGVIVGPQGALYGSAEGGYGDGLIYEVTPPPTACTTALCSPDETTIYEFTGYPDVATGRVTAFDSAGNLYGIGGSGAYGAGAVFELSPSGGGWTEKILYSFTGGNDGGAPSSLVLDLDGNLYGTAYYGGLNQLGVVFQLVPSAGGWTENVLYNFSGSETDGEYPGGLIQDSHGNLYGFSTCNSEGGGADCWGLYTEGLIFELSPPGGVYFLNTLSSDWGFCSSNGSWSWFSALAVDPTGKLYAAANGFAYYYPTGYASCGAVGSITYPWQILWANNAGSASIFENLTLDARGNLYGTTASCGPGNDGIVWEYSP